MTTDLLFCSSSELYRIPADAVVSITADGNYSTITTSDGAGHILTMQLGQIEKYIATRIQADDNRFIRIGKSLIVNRDYIVLINPARQKITLSDCRTFRYDLAASREALKALKDYFEKEDKQ